MGWRAGGTRASFLQRTAGGGWRRRTSACRRVRGGARQGCAARSWRCWPGVGVTWYTWLEQGREINASTQVLDAVARTLRLDRAEREHLYRLAEATPLRTECRAARCPAEVREIVALARPAAGHPDQRPVRHPAVERGAPRTCSGSGTRCRASTRTRCGAASPSRPPGGKFPQYEQEVRYLVARLRAAYARHVGDPDWEEDIRRLCRPEP